jgi:hypothetical protein
MKVSSQLHAPAKNPAVKLLDRPTLMKEARSRFTYYGLLANCFLLYKVKGKGKGKVVPVLFFN